MEKTVFDLELSGQDKKIGAYPQGYLKETRDIELPPQQSQNERDPTIICGQESKSLLEQIKNIQDIAEVKRQKIIRIKRQIEFSKDEINKLKESFI